jgi:hypothetical protein
MPTDGGLGGDEVGPELAIFDYCSFRISVIKRCNQSVTLETENNPNRPKVFQIGSCKWLIYKSLKMMGNRLGSRN